MSAAPHHPPAPTASTRPLKVLQAIEHLDVGGGGASVIQLATRLNQGRFRSQVVTFRPGAMDTRLREAGIDLVHLSAPKVHRLSAIRAHILACRPDIVHSHMFSAGLWVRTALPYRHNQVVVHSHHTLAFKERAWKRYLPERLLTRRTAAVVCVSEAVRKHLVETWRLPAAPMLVIPNGIDTARFACATRHIDTPLRIVAVGRIDPVKGYADLLQAMAILRDQHTPCVCTLVGDGPHRGALEVLRDQLGLQEQVTFMGECDDVSGVLAAGHVFAAPSYREGLSLAVLEAMAASLPIVATSVGGNPELLGNFFDLIQPGQPDAIAEQLTRIVRHPEAALAAGRQAQDHVGRHYSLDAMVQAHETLYARLAAREPSHA